MHARKSPGALALLVGICLSSLLYPGSVGATTIPAGFRTTVARMLAEQTSPSAPGAAVVVTLRGKPIFRRCCGLASVEHGVPITPETRFNLASVAKQFVALAILMLEQEGTLRLDDDVRRYLPELPAYPDTVTIRHLLNHTSGIWEYSAVLFPYCGYTARDRVSLGAVMEALKAQRALLFAPGSQWSYCNTNYVLLAQVAERVTGIGFREWTKQHLFDALGMRDTQFMRDGSQVIPRAAGSYRSRRGEWVDASPAWVDFVGPSDLFTTIDDMVRWMDNFRTAKVGGTPVVRRMFQRAALNDGAECDYGFGLAVLERRGTLVLGHVGGTGGFRTAMLYCPELALGITVLANGQSIDAGDLADRILGAFLGDPPGTRATGPAATPALVPFAAEAATAFAGGYVVDGSNAMLAVRVDEGSLHGAIFGLGEDSFYPTGARSFSNRAGGNQVTFDDLSEGRARTAVVSVKGDRLTARRVALDEEALRARLPAYSGNYYCEALGNGFGVRVTDEALVVSSRRTGDAPAQAIAVDRFFCSLGFVEFKRGLAGEVVGFTLTPSDERMGFQEFEFARVR